MEASCYSSEDVVLRLLLPNKSSLHCSNLCEQLAAWFVFIVWTNLLQGPASLSVQEAVSHLLHQKTFAHNLDIYTCWPSPSHLVVAHRGMIWSTTAGPNAVQNKRCYKTLCMHRAKAAFICSSCCDTANSSCRCASRVQTKCVTMPAIQHHAVPGLNPLAVCIEVGVGLPLSIQHSSVLLQVAALLLNDLQKLCDLLSLHCTHATEHRVLLEMKAYSDRV